MGAWGKGVFQNDSALDWVGDLCDGAPGVSVREALGKIVRHGPSKRYPPSLIKRLIGHRGRTDWLTADDSCGGLAAAEVVAMWRGQPVEEMPEDLVRWATNHRKDFNEDLIPLALKAVKLVVESSELRELWLGSDRDEWITVVRELELRLQMGPGAKLP